MADGPTNPTPVPGPGRFSTRSDRGTAQLAAPGGPYGARQALEAQQQAAPVPVGQQQAPDGPVQATGGGAAVPQSAGVFGPTERPNESPLAGVSGGQPDQEDGDVELMLRAMYAKFPTPYIGRLLNG